MSFFSQLPWIVFAFTAMLCTVTYSLVSKSILNREEEHHPIAYASTLFLAVAVYVVFFYFTTSFNVSDFLALLQPQAFLLIVANVILYTLAPSLYFRALKNLPLSETTILYSLVGIYALFLGSIFGTESFHISRFIGGALVVLSIIIISLKKGQLKIDKNFFLMVAATLVYAFAALTDNQIIDHHYFSTLFFQLINFAVPAVLIILFNPGSFKHLKKLYTKKTYPLILLNGGFFFVSYFSIFTAYSRGGEASQINIILATETIVMVVLAALLLKERERLPLKLIAALLTAVGVYLIA
jgi:drug/metabolite transporter (DMT)-like permease